MNNTLTNRIEWIDLAKGMAIILVVLGHSPATMDMKTFIYGFHIPLFFFLSGFLFRPQRFGSFVKFLTYEFKTVVAPYLIFTAIKYLIYVLWENSSIYNSNYSPYFIIKSVLYSSAETLKLDPILWFLPCLFVVQLLFFLVLKFSTNKTFIAIILIAFSIGGYLYGDYTDVRLPWFADSALTAMVFYGMGFLYKNYDSYVDSKISSYYPEVLMSSFVSLCIFTYLNTTVDMFSMIYNNYFYYYITAVSGIIFCVVFSKIVKKSMLLSYLGKNTILLFAFHVNMFNLIHLTLRFINNNFGTQYIVIESVNWSILFTSVSILLLIPVITVVNKCKQMMRDKKTIRSTVSEEA